MNRILIVDFLFVRQSYQKIQMNYFYVLHIFSKSANHHWVEHNRLLIVYAIETDWFVFSSSSLHFVFFVWAPPEIRKKKERRQFRRADILIINFFLQHHRFFSLHLILEHVVVFVCFTACTPLFAWSLLLTLLSLALVSNKLFFRILSLVLFFSFFTEKIVTFQCLSRDDWVSKKNKSTVIYWLVSDETKLIYHIVDLLIGLLCFSHCVPNFFPYPIYLYRRRIHIKQNSISSMYLDLMRM